MKKIPVNSFTFCREEAPACVGVSIMMNLTINMNSNDLNHPDLFRLNKTMFFVQKFIIIIFCLTRRPE